MDNEPETLGGSGGRTERTESGRTHLQDARLERMAIRRGWLKGQRWATDATVTDLMKVQQERDLTLRERAVLAVMSDIAGKDARIRQIAVKSAIAMEGQNQADEMPEAKADTQVNVNVGVQVNQAVQNAVGSEPEYLEWLRQRELAESGHADAVGANGFAAKVPHAAPRLGDGPGGN